MSNANAPKVLYHYCSLSAFTSITSSKEIRLTDLLKSNDYLEGLWLYNAIVDTLDVMEDAKRQELPVLKSPEEYKLEESRNLLFSRFRQYVEDAQTIQTANDAFYGFCLSEEKDLLSQWRGYADDGQGVAIGFSTEFLQSVCGSLSEGSYVCFNSIKYGSQQLLQFLVDEMASYTLLTTAPKGSTWPDEYTKLRLNIESIFFKNSSFKEEKEWRLVFRDQRNRGAESDSLHRFGKATISTRKWYARGNKLIPYHVLDYKDVPDAIQSIVIGPKCLIANDDMRNYLDDTGYDSKKIAIERSGSSYR